MAKKMKKSTKFSELLEENPEAGEVLRQAGMHCVGCPMAMHESIEQGAIAHGIDPEKLMGKINRRKKK